MFMFPDLQIESTAKESSSIIQTILSEGKIPTTSTTTLVGTFTVTVYRKLCIHM